MAAVVLVPLLFQSFPVSARSQTIELYRRLVDPLALARLDEPDFVRTRLNYGMGSGYKQSETDPGYGVCAEDTGCGIITHLFVTARTPDSLTNYRLYLDGRLVRSAGLDRFFSSPVGILRAPFDTIIGEARLCDVQIPYSHGFTLLYRSNDGRTFFNYGWRPMPEGSIPSSTVNLLSASNLSQQQLAEAVYNDPALLWKGFGGMDSSFQLRVAPGARRSALRIGGPGVVREVRIALDTYSVALDSLWVRLYYDDKDIPGFSAPFMALCGQSYDFRELRSLPVLFSRDSNERSPGGLTLRFPIPFVHSVRLEFLNSSADTLGVRGSVTWRPYPVTRDVYGYLHAAFSETPLTKWGVPHTVLHTHGRGRYVGMLMGIHDLKSGSTYEGDPIFTVDSLAAYSFHYDGMEDYFNGAQYFSHGEFLSPFAGTSNLFANYYRFHYLDAINFFRSLDLDFQHGVGNNCSEHYRTLALWYEQPIRFWTNKDSVRLGHPLRIKGAGYPGASAIDIELAACDGRSADTAFSLLAKVHCESDGGFDTNVTIVGRSAGFYRLRVVGDAGVGTEVQAVPIFVHSGPTVQLLSLPKPLQLQTNDTVLLSGEGYDASSADSITAFLVSDDKSSPDAAAEVHAAIDSIGRLHGWLVVPDIPNGDHRVLIVASKSGPALSSETVRTSRTLRYESEWLWDSTSSTKGRSRWINVSWLYNWDWSHNGVIDFRPRRVGDTLVTRFWVPVTDSFLVYTRLAEGHEFGNFDVQFDHEPPVRFDGYRDIDRVPSDSIKLAHSLLERGYHSVRYVYRDRANDPSSGIATDSALWTDFVELVPLTKPKLSAVERRDLLPQPSEIAIVNNPVRNGTLELRSTGQPTVTIFGETGRVVIPETNAVLARDGTMQIDVRNLASGSYIVRATSGMVGHFVIER